MACWPPAAVLGFVPFRRRRWDGRRIQLVQRGEHKDRRLSHTRLGLADNISTEHRLRNGFVLHFGRVLETGIHNRTEQFGLEEEILESGSVNAHVVALLAATFLSRSGARVLGDLGYLLRMDGVAIQ